MIACVTKRESRRRKTKKLVLEGMALQAHLR
jgi:hypothetical protein